MKRGPMKRSLPFWSLLILSFTMNANAQLYKWVGPDGKVTYTDTPPPQAAKQVETKPSAGGAVSPAGLPYELSQAVKAHRVTLYTTSNCAPCEEGRKLLSARGIPFAEKTVNSDEDVVQYKKLSGSGELPLLIVGRDMQRGFESSAWHAALNAAGYPESSKLPGSYRNPAPEAAAPPRPVPAQAPESPGRREPVAGARTPNGAEPPAPTGNAPPGFRF